jgi:hypothetical protein
MFHSFSVEAIAAATAVEPTELGRALGSPASERASSPVIGAGASLSSRASSTVAPIASSMASS